MQPILATLSICFCSLSVGFFLPILFSFTHSRYLIVFQNSNFNSTIFFSHASFDSCSTFDKNHTVNGQKKPNILADVNVTKEALELLHQGIDDHQCYKHYCLGNHELRLYCYENEHKEVLGAFSQQYENLCRQRGWGVSEYGDF